MKEPKSIDEALKFVFGHSNLFSLRNLLPIEGDKRDWVKTLKYINNLNQHKNN